MPPPHNFHRPVRVLAGLYVCGDHRDTSSAHGAMVSGRRAALAVLRDLGISGAEAGQDRAAA
jgi:predicted NAD/FAD-dependent oxidoreductase